MLKRKTIKQIVVEGVGAIWFFLALVSTIVLIVLNCTPIYQYVIDKYQLSLITGLSAEKLMLNYKSIISYLQRPSGGYLELPDFVMSEAGMIHFAGSLAFSKKMYPQSANSFYDVKNLSGLIYMNQ